MVVFGAVLGNTGFAGAESTDAEIGDIYVYNRALSQAEIDQVNKLLLRKYGLDVPIIDPVCDGFSLCVSSHPVCFLSVSGVSADSQRLSDNIVVF